MVTARATTMGKTQVQLKFILPHLEVYGEVGYTTRIGYGGYVPVKRPKLRINAFPALSDCGQTGSAERPETAL